MSHRPMTNQNFSWLCHKSHGLMSWAKWYSSMEVLLGVVIAWLKFMVSNQWKSVVWQGKWKFIITFLMNVCSIEWFYLRNMYILLAYALYSVEIHPIFLHKISPSCKQGVWQQLPPPSVHLCHPHMYMSKMIIVMQWKDSMFSLLFAPPCPPHCHT